MPHLTLIITAARNALASYENDFHLSKEKIMETTLDFLLAHDEEWKKTQKQPEIIADSNTVLVFVGLSLLRSPLVPSSNNPHEAKLEPSPLYQDLNEFMATLLEKIKDKIAADFYNEMLHIIDLVKKPEKGEAGLGESPKSTLTRLLGAKVGLETEEKISTATQTFDISNLVTLMEQAFVVTHPPESPSNNNAGVLSREEMNTCKEYLTDYYYEVCNEDKTTPSQEICTQVLSLMKKVQMKLPQGILGCFPRLEDFIASEESQESSFQTCIQLTSSLRGARTVIGRMKALLAEVDNRPDDPVPGAMLNRRPSFNISLGSATAITRLGMRSRANSVAAPGVQKGVSKPPEPPFGGM